MCRAIRTATSAENADSRPAQKNTAPLTASDSPKRLLQPQHHQGGDHEAAAEHVEAEQRGQAVDGSLRWPERAVRRVARLLDRRAESAVTQQHHEAEQGVCDERAPQGRGRVDVEASRQPLRHTQRRAAPTAATSVPISA